MKKAFLLLFSFVCIAWSPLHGGETVLLNDTFDAEMLSGGDSEDLQVYSLQDLPRSAEWLSSYQDKSTSETAALVFSSVDENRGMTLRFLPDVGTFNVMARFTESSSEPVQLKVGDSLTLSFTLSASNPKSAYRAIAIGLLYSHGAELEAPYYVTQTSAPFSGYLVRTNFGSDDSPFGTVLSRRVSSQNQHSLYHSDTLKEDSFTEGYHTRSLALEDGVPVEGSLTITRIDENTNAIQFLMNGIALSTSESPAEDFVFDSINFGFSPEAADSMTLNHIKVVLTTSDSKPSKQK